MSNKTFLQISVAPVALMHVTIDAPGDWRGILQIVCIVISVHAQITTPM